MAGLASRFDRRSFLTGVVAAPALHLLGPGAASALPSSPRAEADGFRQDPALVQEVVGASHRDLDRVRALVESRPALARATWDWGFGDWESALGAASHTGRREIAELLIAHGARPTLFTLAMLGHVDAVRAWVQALPGVEAIPGPHGITLLAHARAGREAASAVVDYLEGLGTADPRAVSEPLDARARADLIGTYAFGSGEAERLEIGENAQELLTLTPAGGVVRNLFHLGGRAFHPAGVPSVRIQFPDGDGEARTLTIHDGDQRLEARRV